MAKLFTLSEKRRKPKIRRRCIHAKTKMSTSKSSKNYKKIYVGQG